MGGVDQAQLKEAKALITELLKETKPHPLLVRLAWHDSGTYNKASAASKDVVPPLLRFPFAQFLVLAMKWHLAFSAFGPNAHGSCMWRG